MQNNRSKKRKIITIFGLKLPAKTWTILLLVVVIILTIAIIFINVNGGNDGENRSDTEILPISGDEPTSEESTPVELGWYLTLVNDNNPLPLDYSPPLSPINTNFTRDGDVFYFHSFAVENLNEMLYAAQRAGNYLFALSSYRSVERQQVLFNNQVQTHLAAGMEQEAAEIAATAQVARPGTSERQSGLVVDLNATNESFAGTPHFKWLQENAHKYGFILRHGRGTKDITGAEFEPWHWRFVGVTHARTMREENITLEEYIARLLGEEK